MASDTNSEQPESSNDAPADHTDHTDHTGPTDPAGHADRTDRAGLTGLTGLTDPAANPEQPGRLADAPPPPPLPPPAPDGIRERACAWCARPIVVEHRPGRPRLYCHHACRQRAYEHRHGFRHERTITTLPGQATGEPWGGTGYERGIAGYARGKAHALRTSVRPEGRRRQTLCGLLAFPAPIGGHFSPLDRRACHTCTRIAETVPLTLGINPSNELARLRALIDETTEQRLDPRAALAWLQRYAPESAQRPHHPPDSGA